MLITASLLVKFGWKGLVASSHQPATGDLSARLSDIDPSDYDFNGNLKPAQQASPDMDAFFSNTSRRDALMRPKKEPEPDPVLFDVPSIDELPAREPNEPRVSATACKRLINIVIAAEDRLKTNPNYEYTAKERFADLASRASGLCGEGFVFTLQTNPDIELFRAFKDVARVLKAHDLEAIIDLQLRALQMTSTPDWRNLDRRDEEAWWPAVQTAGALGDMFTEVNETYRSQNRLRTLAEAYLAKIA